jgi:hypothetical protein
MGVRRKTTIIATLAILITAATAGYSPVYARAVSSMQNFQRNFKDLKKADSLSPIERFVFSLALSHSKTPTAAANSSVPSAGRM